MLQLYEHSISVWSQKSTFSSGPKNRKVKNNHFPHILAIIGKWNFIPSGPFSHSGSHIQTWFLHGHCLAEWYWAVYTTCSCYHSSENVSSVSHFYILQTSKEKCTLIRCCPLGLYYTHLITQHHFADTMDGNRSTIQSWQFHTTSWIYWECGNLPSQWLWDQMVCARICLSVSAFRSCCYCCY